MLWCQTVHQKNQLAAHLLRNFLRAAANLARLPAGGEMTGAAAAVHQQPGELAVWPKCH
jgi:hypothetical protein